jgi:transcription antitermination factor NusG
VSSYSERPLPSAAHLATPPAFTWFALHTHSRHEKKVAKQLTEKHIEAFVPTFRQVHTWTDRRKSVDVPLFSCYVFLQVTAWRDVYDFVARTPGVFRWLGSQGEPTAIPNAQIDAIRRSLAMNLDVAPYPFLKVGDRVRIRTGCMEGVEGILVRKGRDSRFVISIDPLQQSISMSIEGYQIEAA